MGRNSMQINKNSHTPKKLLAIRDKQPTGIEPQTCCILYGCLTTDLYRPTLNRDRNFQHKVLYGLYPHSNCVTKLQIS